MAKLREYKTWRERYNDLANFQERYNKLPSLKPSAMGKPQYTLASWLARQRKNKRNKLLTQRQIEILESLGVIWNPTKENKKRWEEQFNKLVEFRKKNSGKWPSKDAKDKGERSIAYWCHNNRMWYQGKLRDVGPYPKYRKVALNKIGFEWYPEARNKRWNAKYDELKKYRKENPDRWPPVSMYPLYKWIFKQKTRYRRGILKKDRIALLNKLGIEWNSRKNQRKT
ncbi:helicase associated domain-containing protein [Desulfobacterota bacterium AH_259_B03_O07]|nr:helicase associated domain-containing protein [Desulfobacterota bacterium AH_259_B03_O07]